MDTNKSLLDLLDLIDDTLDKMVDFGSDVEEVFYTQHDINKTKPEKFEDLMNRGDVIRDELTIHKKALQKLRGTLQ